MILKSLRAKFAVYVAVLLVIIFCVANIFPIISSRDAIYREKETSLTNQGSTAVSALLSLEHLTARNIEEVFNILDLDGYSRVLVANETGEIIYDSAGETAEQEVPEDIFTALSGETVFRSRFQNSAFVSSYTIPMIVQKETVGALYLAETDEEPAEILLTMQSRLRTILLILCLITGAVTIVFLSSFLHRIHTISQSMQTVAEGDYSHRMTVKGSDEISELGQDFNMLTERLQTTEQQRRRFVSDASHELKTPLASIRLLSDSITQSEQMDSATMREFVSDISHEADRLQRTTEKLLDLSRLDDDIQVAREPVDLKQVILDANATLSPVAKEKGVRIRLYLEDGCVLMATTDDMYHVIFNLMENAVKYNVPEGMVDVELKGKEETLNLTVKDTGIGIPENERLNVFTRFYRVDKARSREAGGSGLGLSIVHDCVKRYGGSITVGANQPQGSVFTVNFPRPSEEEIGI